MPALAALVLGGGCDPGPAAPPVAVTIRVSPPTSVLEEPGDTVRLTATVMDQYGEIMPMVDVTWSSTDTFVVRLSEDGLVTATETGKALVEVTAATVTGDATVVVPPGSRAVLHKFYRVMGGDDWGDNTNWKTSLPLETWHGVHAIGGGDVWSLMLERNGLSGEIPPELGDLRELGQLNLGYNGITGEIPPELGNLWNLRELHLYRNGIGGAIPPELGNLWNLEELHLDSNELTGSIPPELANLQDLRELYLDSNELTGSIPPELGNLPELRYLDLHSNRLTGPVPPQLGSNRHLAALLIADNPLTGALPRELMRLRRLQRFIWNDTDLCAPADDDFQSWLETIREQVGNGNCAP